MKIKSTNYKISRCLLYVVLIILTAVMLIPFAWMFSASLKLDKDVFIFPIQWIPDNPRWQNYLDIW
ncbi:carbohydrate ABC transporter permease, partial [Clostridioides difficile]|nr:carbohydrate ABC transporter permease [Clostridioides difficile]